MSSDEDYSQRESSDGLRRSKRVASYDKILRSKVTKKKTHEKSSKRSAGKNKSTPSKKQKLDEPLGKEETSESLNGSCLTAVELHQLFLKFKRDGHFRLSPPKVSQAPLVISRTSDGKNVTTKIECYKTKRQFVHNLASQFITHNTETEDPEATSDPTSVTFTTPLAEKSFGNSIPTSPNPEQYILPTISSDNSFAPYKTSNNSQTMLNSLLDPNKSPGVGNACLGNSIGSRPRPTSLLITTNGQQNVPAWPNPMFVNPAPSTWIPPGHLENRNDSNASGICFSNNNNNTLYSSTVVSSKVHRFDYNSSENNSIGSLDSPNLLSQFNFLNFKAAGLDVTSYHQSEANAQNSSSNVFGTNVSTIYTSPISSMSYVSPRINPYNPGIGNVNSSTYGVSPSGNSPMNESNGYRPSVTSWNKGQLLSSSYDTSVSMPYVPYCAYSAPNASEACKTAANPVMSVQGGTDDQANSWSQCNQTDKDFLQLNGNETCDSLPTTLNNFPINSTMMIGSNVLAAITDPEIKLSQSTEQLAFDLDNVGDWQNSGTGLIVPPICSFNYDISYDKYTGRDLHYSGDNLNSTTQVNDFSPRLPSVGSNKSEMRSWYGVNNGNYTNNSPSNNASDLEFHDIEVKESLVDSSSCYVANGPSSS